jgi:release factor glutamine methyltransferase
MEGEATIADMLREAQSRLVVSESARLDAEVLMCAVLGVPRATLYAQPEQALPLPVRARYRHLVGERLRGVPVAQLTGQREFWSLTLHVNEHTLIPRPETEHLVEAALERLLEGEPANVADLGTGSGAVALALASERARWRIVATDVSAQALAVAQRNAQRHQLGNVSFRRGSWYEPLGEVKLDLIISNPPYVASGDPRLAQGDVRFEPRLALVAGSEGLDALNLIIEGAPDRLRSSGWLLVEHGNTQGAAVRALMRQAGLSSIETLLDLAGQERVTAGCRRHGG